MFHIVPENIDVDFVGKRGTFAILSLLIVVASIGLVAFIGPNYGIDFKGGSDVILKFNSSVTADEVREAAVTVFPDANVQRFGEVEKHEFLVQTQAVSVMNADKVEEVKAVLEPLAPVERVTWSPEQPDRLDVVYKEMVEASKIKEAVADVGLEGVEAEHLGVAGEPRYVVRFQDLGQKVRTGFADAMGDKFDPTTGLERLETVGPRVGEQLRNSGVLSILVALLLILIYIAFRFDVRYAPGAVAALAHDVIISVGVFTIIQMEISLPIIAALLTIVGYSLNDTIVVFDRIRENLTEEGDADVVGTVNRSINETLSRTIITSLTTLLAVFAIYFFGIGLIKDFAFALIVGIAVGTYSSVFIASPVMIAMDRYLRTRRATQKATQA
jgi:preprotein translocase subunit SecF